MFLQLGTAQATRRHQLLLHVTVTVVYCEHGKIKYIHMYVHVVIGWIRGVLRRISGAEG